MVKGHRRRQAEIARRSDHLSIVIELLRGELAGRRLDARPLDRKAHGVLPGRGDQSPVFCEPVIRVARRPARLLGDRKSTRLNSSHLVISYAVFCLKKKTET